MMLKNVLGLISLFISLEVMAAGKGGGSVTDLIYPAINFSLLFGFILWKVKGPMSEMFTNNSETVESQYKLAEQKDKEAQTLLGMYEEKLKASDAEVESLINDAKSDAEKFEKTHLEDIQKTIARMHTDAEQKIDHEKDQMIREVNASLIDEVISKTKNTISSNNDYQKKVTSNLLKQI